MIGNLDYNLRESGRARNVTLKVSQANGLVVVVPIGFDRELLPDILNSRQSWIERQLERFEALPGRFDGDWPPSSLQLRGIGCVFQVEYKQAEGSRIRLDERGDLLTVSIPENCSDESLAVFFVKWLKKLAQQHCETIVRELAMVTGLKYKKLSVRGQKTRWGSYSSHGTISLNFKLLFLPESLLRHVVLHELSHSVHMDHSPEFWNLLGSVDPASDQHDKQLSDAWQYLPGWLD